VKHRRERVATARATCVAALAAAAAVWGAGVAGAGVACTATASMDASQLVRSCVDGRSYRIDSSSGDFSRTYRFQGMICTETGNTRTKATKATCPNGIEFAYDGGKLYRGIYRTPQLGGDATCAFAYTSDGSGFRDDGVSSSTTCSDGSSYLSYANGSYRHTWVDAHGVRHELGYDAATRRWSA
jgi:hypothetical protein